MIESENKVQAVIFDYDGTLLDSMPAWHTLEKDLAWMSGITLSFEERQHINSFTLAQLVSYFHTVYGIGKSYETLYDQALRQLHHHYQTIVAPRAGAIGFVEQLHNDNITLAVVSASPLSLLEAGLKRFGIYDFFDLVISADKEGESKENPRFLLSVAERLHVDPSHTWCIDDSVYALKTMNKVGFKTLGIYDSDTAGTWKELEECADAVINGFDSITYEAFLGTDRTTQTQTPCSEHIPA